MKQASVQFLGIEQEFCDFQSSKIVVLPFGYEGGVSYGKGAADAPQAVIQASHYLELYDEVLDSEPFRMGIFTAEPPHIPKEPQAMQACIYNQVKTLLEKDKIIIVIGGDHSISSGAFKAFSEKYDELGCIQIDAHSDLRNEYNDDRLSHACVMARIREMTKHTCQLGIRSQSVEEAELIKRQSLNVFNMHTMRSPDFNLEQILKGLPEKIYLTFDVDALDWSVVASTGTPEPGGFSWDEILSLLQVIFSCKTVVGIDIVELAANENDRNSPFAVAKLIYKMLGFLATK